MDTTLPEIVQVDYESLRTVAQPVPIEQIQSPEIQSLIKTMVHVMRNAPGVGLAAPQIGDSRQIIVLEDKQEYIDFRLKPEEALERGRVPFPLKVIINPKLTFIRSTSDHGPQKFKEGCLSVKGYVADVERAWEVKVEGWDENAKPFEWQVSGWPARILQHEVDHLNGILYVDRMDSKTFKNTSVQ